MKSDELIAHLQELQTQYGVQDVYVEGQSDSWPMNILDVFRGYATTGKVTSFRIESEERPDWV